MGRRKPNQWIYKHQPSPMAQHVDASKIIEATEALMNAIFPRTSRKYIKFTVSNIALVEELGEWRTHASWLTVKTALNAGYTDLHFMMKVNPLESRTVSKTFKKEWYRAKTTGNWRLDLDKTKFSSIPEVVEHLLKLKCLMPVAIVQTSQNNFHLVYIGSEKEWTYSAKFNLVCKIAEVPASCSKESTKDILKNFGVDLQQLKTVIDLHEVRLPFSINHKKSIGGNIATVVDYWINPKKVRTEIVSDLEPLTVVKEKNEYKWNLSKKINFLTSEFASFLNPEDSEMMGEILGSGWYFLKHNNCRILQEWWANRLGVAQYTLSRKLTKMVKSGYLTVVDEWVRGKKAKTYGLGPKLAIIFEKLQSSIKEYDFYQPLLDGQSNPRIMEDIRQAVFWGLSEDEIVSIILKKQSNRPNKKKRREKDLRRLYQKHVEHVGPRAVGAALKVG